MSPSEFESILKVGEQIGVEFKAARSGAKDRDKILREMIGNTLVHREFSSARPANFVIYADRMTADNASKALKCGPVTLENLSPVSKNPIIARFFKQMDAPMNSTREPRTSTTIHGSTPERIPDLTKEIPSRSPSP